MTGYHTYKSCIEACLKCAAICNHCASSCTQEENIKMMAGCIQLDMECAAICYAAAQVMSMGGRKSKELCLICADICDTCAAECSQHNTEHCQECAEACRECADACRSILNGNTNAADENRVPVPPEMMHSDYGSSGAAPVGAFDTGNS
ncbi:four-helix bundle copper-binding protein [Segetibacter koreensis]|uniref:four-helix bundle copper-binding protein n=1 Tax=Segetibacter koreensis TaxID=398037 RepID=UPI000362E22F|nr:four-helix bundle copper-binding protein [Segetibacter koreensis]